MMKMLDREITLIIEVTDDGDGKWQQSKYSHPGRRLDEVRSKLKNRLIEQPGSACIPLKAEDRCMHTLGQVYLHFYIVQMIPNNSRLAGKTPSRKNSVRACHGVPIVSPDVSPLLTLKLFQTSPP